MSDKGWRFRPMLVGDVARVAGVPRETLRVWIRRGIFDFDRPKGGWKRFSDFETLLVAIYAQVLRATQDHELANLAQLVGSKFLVEEWHEDEKGVPHFQMETFDRARYMMFHRDDKGHFSWSISEAPEEVQAQMDQMFGDSQNVSPVFTVINLGTILKKALLEVMKVQVEMAGDSEGSE